MDGQRHFHKKYDRVMPRVHSQSKLSLNSKCFVTKHDRSVVSPKKVVKCNSSDSSGAFIELPTVLNDYVSVSERENMKKRSKVVKPRRTLQSLDPKLSPVKTGQKFLKPGESNIRMPNSAPSVMNRESKNQAVTAAAEIARTSESKLRQLQEEINSYREIERSLKLQAKLFKRCGILLEDDADNTEDKGVQVTGEEEACGDSYRPHEHCIGADAGASLPDQQMRAADPGYPVDKYLVKDDQQFDLKDILGDDLWEEEPALTPEDELMLRRLHDILQTTADDLRSLSQELCEGRGGIIRRTRPAPLDSQFNEQVRIQEMVDAKFNGKRIVDQTQPPPPKPQQPPPMKTKIEPEQQPKPAKKLSVSATKVIQVDEETGAKAETNIQPSPTIAYSEFNYEEKHSFTDNLKVQELPKINIRSELSMQKVFDMNIVPEQKDGKDNLKRSNSLVVEMKHEEKKSNEPKPTQQFKQVSSFIHSVVTPIVRKSVKIPNCDTATGTRSHGGARPNTNTRSGIGNNPCHPGSSRRTNDGMSGVPPDFIYLPGNQTMPPNDGAPSAPNNASQFSNVMNLLMTHHDYLLGSNGDMGIVPTNLIYFPGNQSNPPNDHGNPATNNASQFSNVMTGNDLDNSLRSNVGMGSVPPNFIYLPGNQSNPPNDRGNPATNNASQFSNVMTGNDLDNSLRSNVGTGGIPPNFIYLPGNPPIPPNDRATSAPNNASQFPNGADFSNTGYIPYSQLTVGGLRLTDIENAINEYPDKENVRLSPILDKLLSSRGTTATNDHKLQRIVVPFDMNLLREVEALNDAIIISLASAEILNEAETSEDSAGYDDDFEDEYSGYERNDPPPHTEGPFPDDPNIDYSSPKRQPDSNEASKKAGNQFPDSIGVYQYFQTIKTEDNSTQAKADTTIQETQTFPLSKSEHIRTSNVVQQTETAKEEMAQKNTQTTPRVVKAVLTSPRGSKNRSTSPILINILAEEPDCPIPETYEFNPNDIGNTLDLTTGSFGRNLPQTYRDVLSYMENPMNTKKGSKAKPAEKQSFSTSVDAESSSDMSSLGEIKQRLKRSLRKKRLSSASGSSTSSAPTSSYKAPTRSEGEIPMRDNNKGRTE